jgi:RNA-directed DNA polymerase
MSESERERASERPRSRQAIYDHIRASSKDEFIREDMVRLGFWPSREPRPSDPAEEQRRREEILRELRALQTEGSRLKDEAKLKAEARKQRIEASRAKQQANKARRATDRAAAAEAWRARGESELLYLGAGASAGLGPTGTAATGTAHPSLPALEGPLSLARWLGLSMGQLRFLAFQRTVSRVSHYARFRIPKKTGGDRLISAPMPRLKAVQHRIATALLREVPVHERAHGFVPGRSITTNAAPHVGAAVLVNLDLQDFFPSIHWRRVRGVFRTLGYSEAVSTVLALLCTEAPVEAWELDGQRWFVQTGPRALPQGAPTSPALTNLLCRSLDRQCEKLGERLGFTYTRYADDLTFSSTDPEARVGALLYRLRKDLDRHGLTEHPKKTRVLRQGRRMEVTGLIVNHKLAVPREELRRFRAVLHKIDRAGPTGAEWRPGIELWAGLRGFAGYVFMVDPARGQTLRDRVEELAGRYEVKAPAPVVRSAPVAAPVVAPVVTAAPTVTAPLPEVAPAPEPPAKKPWWKLF